MELTRRRRPPAALGRLALALLLSAATLLPTLAGAQAAPTRAPTRAPLPRATLGFLADAVPATSLPVVVMVLANSPASRAGLAVGDTIVRVGDQAATLAVIRQASYALRAGDRIGFRIRRAAREFLVTLVVQEVQPASAEPVLVRDSVAARATTYLAAACREVNGPPKTAADSAAVLCATRAPTRVMDVPGTPGSGMMPSRVMPLRRFVDAWGARFEATADPAASTSALTRVVVRTVASGSAAERAGLTVGDVVTTVRGEQRGLMNAVAEASESGAAVELVVDRGGATHRVKLDGKAGRE